jgi:hypothetical protein
MKGIAVNARIQLLDVDRPGEIFEVELEATTPTRLALSVPNTIIRFDLYQAGWRTGLLRLPRRAAFCLHTAREGAEVRRQEGIVTSK